MYRDANGHQQVCRKMLIYIYINASVQAWICQLLVWNNWKLWLFGQYSFALYLFGLSTFSTRQFLFICIYTSYFLCTGMLVAINNYAGKCLKVDCCINKYAGVNRLKLQVSTWSTNGSSTRELSALKHENPLTDLWPHIHWGHMCNSTQLSLCPTPMEIHHSVWIQWPFLHKQT